MNNGHPCLPESTLTTITANRASEADLTRWEQHLQSCDTCCRRLETLSADAQTWEAVRRFLPDDCHDEQRFTGNVTAAGEASNDLAELLRFLAPSEDSRMLGRLDSYGIAEVIGIGGMGLVLKAFDPALTRFVALKILAPKFWKDAQARERFAREARAAASIVHENVIEIYGVAEVDGIPFFTMPFLRADSLQKRIDRQTPLQVDEILRIAMQVAAGLAAAHAQGLVHRDVKPANILLSDGAERVRITDFGIAHLIADPRITQTGWVAGTPQYMSPEQVRGDAVDGRSDLFSLGSVMYAMCAGIPPFAGDSNYELLSQVVAAKPRPVEELNPSIPSWLAAIIAKLHAPLPAGRYQSAGELLHDLEPCLTFLQQPETVSLPRAVTRLDARYRRQRRSRERSFFLGGLLMLATLAMGVLFPAMMLWTTPAAQSIEVRGRLVDEQGAAIADTTILAVQKTWPNDRYRQQVRRTTTDKNGNFVFDSFAEPGKQYAFLLTVVSDQWLMTSVYRVVGDGKQQDPITLETAKAVPVTIRLLDPNEKPLAKINVLPTDRITADEKEYISYSQQVWKSGVSTDEKGEVRFGSWKAGEKGAIVYQINDQLKPAQFVVPENRIVTVTVEPPAAKPEPRPAVHVAGRVLDASGKPVVDTTVLAIRKTWPGNRYQQNALSANTDARGEFRFDNFAPGGQQYAFLLTVLTEGYAMTSHYQVVKDGSQQEPITLRLDPAKPVTFAFRDADGNPVKALEISPAERIVDGALRDPKSPDTEGRATVADEAKRFLNYSMHFQDSRKTTDENGEASFTAWQPGESGSFHYRQQDRQGAVKFKVGEDRRVTIELPGS